MTIALRDVCEDCRERLLDQQSRQLDAQTIGLLIEHGPERLEAESPYLIDSARRILARELARLNNHPATSDAPTIAVAEASTPAPVEGA